MGLISFLQKIRVKIIPGYYSSNQARSSPFNLDAWEHDTFRATVDAIATHGAKGKVQHVIIDNQTGRTKKVLHGSKIARLLNEKPNELMSGFDFKYRMFANLETTTTAIAYLEYSKNENGKTELSAIYPVDYTSFDFYEVRGGGYAIEFTDYDGHTQDLPLEYCVVLRKFYNYHQAGGDGNAPIYKVLDMSKASDEGFIESLTVSNKVRGIFRNKKSMLDPEDVKKGQAEFAERFKKAAKEGGIVGVDSTEDYTTLNVTPYAANAAQMTAINNRIYTYLRTSEKIVQNTYSEEEGQAWYEGKIEPMWEVFVEAFSKVYFSIHEREYGNRLIMNGGILMGTSIQTRVKVLEATKETGELSTDERRELLGYGPIEGGDTRQISLNYIKDKDQSKYQTGKEEDNNAGTDDTGQEPE